MAKSSKKNTKQEESKENPLVDHLERGHAAVLKNEATALELHSQWRTHLLRMSFIVIVVTFHQSQAPMTACMTDIKQLNKLKINSMEEPINGFQAMIAILYDSAVEILGIICATSIAWCLSLPMDNADFSSMPYKMSTVCIPMIVSLYLNNKKVGCLEQEVRQFLEEPSEDQPRGFPVVLIFHAIVTISLWFMHYQVQQNEKYIEMVLKLKKDLKEQRETKKTK